MVQAAGLQINDKQILKELAHLRLKLWWKERNFGGVKTPIFSEIADFIVLMVQGSKAWRLACVYLILR